MFVQRVEAESGSTGSSSCIKCENGTYSGEEGAYECTKCAKDKFAPNEGSSACLRCDTVKGPEYKSNEGASSCELCAKDSYMNDKGNCKSCLTMLQDSYKKAGVKCPEGSTLEEIDVVAGFYRFKETSTTVYECDYPENCVGGNGTAGKLCLPGAEGPLW